MFIFLPPSAVALIRLRTQGGLKSKGSGLGAAIGGLGNKVILGLYWGYIGVILGLYWDNGKENGNYYVGNRELGEDLL